MVNLYNNATNQLIASVSEAELQLLIANLEEESPEDRDYYIDAATIELLAHENAPDRLLQLLRRALGDEEGVEIRWQLS